MCGLSFSLFEFVGKDENCKIVHEERGVDDIVNAMQVYEEDADLVDAACSALWSLAMDGKTQA